MPWIAAYGGYGGVRRCMDLARFREYLTAVRRDTFAIAETRHLMIYLAAKRYAEPWNLIRQIILPGKCYIESLLETLQLLLHDKSAGDDSAAPLIPDETNKIMGQLAQLPDIPEKYNYESVYSA